MIVTVASMKLLPVFRHPTPLFIRIICSRQICNTKIYQPSFPLVLVGMIPTKYQPIPTEIPTPVYNSSVYLLFVVPERIFFVTKLGSPIGVEGIERIRNELAGSRTLFQPNSLCFLRYNNWSCFFCKVKILIIDYIEILLSTNI